MLRFSPRSWLKSWRPASRAARGRTRRTAARLNLESLEDRQLLATFTVTNTNNAGGGSLRQAILNANAGSGRDDIEFRIGQGRQVIALTSPLPEIIHPVNLRGWTQPGYNGTPLITISGQFAGPFAEGLVLSANDSAVLDLTIRSFNGHGIVVYGNSNVIARCHIGIDPPQPVGAGNRGAGVVLQGAGNSLSASVISGNGGSGVMISGAGARNNRVGSPFAVEPGNRIGTNANGTVAVPNGQHGVWIGNGATFTTIGGSNPNVISGNTLAGVALFHTDTIFNEVRGNRIGTNAAGNVALGNGQGVLVGQGARFNSIGVSLVGGQLNVISGNRNEGVVLTDPGTSFNLVHGNFIGTNAAGTAAVPNQRGGVVIGLGASVNRVGGDTAGVGNVISGNTFSGVSLLHGGTTDNVVEGNYIGTTAAGTAALGNTGHGVAVALGAGPNLIGGTSAAARNVISANREAGVLIRDGGTSGNLVLGNYIGTNAAGTAALGNVVGVQIGLGASGNRTGGSTAGARNLISGNRAEGVAVTDPGTVNNVVLGNYIGTDAAGTTALGNLSHGVWVAWGAQSTTIGGSTSGAGNLISGNHGAGVAVARSGTSNTRVLGNTIGLNAAATAALGNSDGVYVAEGASGTFVGGASVGEGNVIAANLRHGIVLRDSGTNNNILRGNWIGFNADGGVAIGPGASANFIGGTAAGESNVIAYNGNNGIVTTAGGRNRLRGNSIYENGALGIDVDHDSVTFAHVVYLTGAWTSGTDTTVEGWVIGAPNATYTVELFENVAGDPSGFGEGETPLAGLHTVSTDADGYGYLLVTLPFPTEVGRCVSATATEADGTTWEFGNCLAVAAGASPGAPGRDAARALSPAEASRSAPLALPPDREHSWAEGITVRAGGALFRDRRPDGAAGDAFFGGAAPLPSSAPPRRTAVALPGEDGLLFWERVFVLDES